MIERSHSALQILRGIIKESRTLIGDRKKQAALPAIQFVLKSARDHQVTSRKLCKGPKELEHLADTYRTYLHSQRRLRVRFLKFMLKF